MCEIWLGEARFCFRLPQPDQLLAQLPQKAAKAKVQNQRHFFVANKTVQHAAYRNTITCRYDCLNPYASELL